MRWAMFVGFYCVSWAQEHFQGTANVFFRNQMGVLSTVELWTMHSCPSEKKCVRLAADSGRLSFSRFQRQKGSWATPSTISLCTPPPPSPPPPPQGLVLRFAHPTCTLMENLMFSSPWRTHNQKYITPSKCCEHAEGACQVHRSQSTQASGVWSQRMPFCMHAAGWMEHAPQERSRRRGQGYKG